MVFVGVGLLVTLGVAGGMLAVLQNSNLASGSSTPTSPGTAKNDVVFGAPAPATPELPASATFAEQSHISGYQSSFYVLGFVTNTSPFTVEKPKVTAVLLDKSGQELATRDGFAEGDALAPQAIAPVKLLVSDPPAHSRIKFEVVVRKASYIPEQARGLRLEVLEAPHVTFGTSWEVTGKVVNGGEQRARFVNVLVQAFDASNRLIGLDSTYADGEAIAAGAVARFRAMPLYDAPPHHFKYTVSGQAAQ